MNSTLTINTGNVLNLLDIKKKAAQNVTEELSESIKLTLKEFSTQKEGVKNGLVASYKFPPALNSASTSRASYSLTPHHDDVKAKMAEEERKNLKIGVKIFINEDSTEALRECLDNVLATLHTELLDNVVLAYEPEDDPRATLRQSLDRKKASPLHPNIEVTDNEDGTEEADSQADAKKCERILPGVKVLWTVLEDYVKKGHVGELGVADVGGGCLRKLHRWARVKPHIAQINLASCCVVPPALHAFCSANDVQLLTHADPADLLKQAAAKSLMEMNLQCNKLDWCARYQVHIKCRGLLALKGYVCKATVTEK